MIIAPRKHLFATNLIIFCLIYLAQKLIRIFCIIEEKACNNADCAQGNRCDERCGNATASPVPMKKNFTLVPTALRGTMRSFGFGEGHYQIFVEEKQRNFPSEDRLNAELKLNPN